MIITFCGHSRISKDAKDESKLLALFDELSNGEDIMLSDADDIKTRNLIVNTFIREIIYYEDKVIITYNFSDTINTDKTTKEHIEEIERQSDSAVNSNPSSCLELPCPPTFVNHPRGWLFFLFGHWTQRHKCHRTMCLNQ